MVSKLVDSNVWIGAFDKDDSLHARAKQMLLSIKERIIIPDFVVAETATVLKFKKDFEAAQYFLRTIHDNAQVEVVYTYQQFDAFMTAFLTGGNNKLSFYDSALTVLSDVYDIVTFDKALQKELKKRL